MSGRSPLATAVLGLFVTLHLTTGFGALAATEVFAGGQAERAAPRGATPRDATPRDSIHGGLYDLQADEQLGGHTLARHVGKSDADLLDRLRRERRISAASTYPDLDTARRVVAAAVSESRGRIDTWARRAGSRPNLVLHYAQADRQSIGQSMARGARVSAICTRALVVLRWHERRGRW